MKVGSIIVDVRLQNGARIEMTAGQRSRVSQVVGSILFSSAPASTPRKTKGKNGKKHVLGARRWTETELGKIDEAIRNQGSESRRQVVLRTARSLGRTPSAVGQKMWERAKHVVS